MTGAILLAVGFAALSTISGTTPYWMIGVYMSISGLGLGMTMQNLVLAVQNSISVRDVGAATGSVTFFRSLGGAVGIQALGFVFQDRLTSLIQQGVPGLLQAAVVQDSTASPANAQVCGGVLQSLAQGGGTSSAIDPAQLSQLAGHCPETTDLLQGMATLEASGGSTMNVAGLPNQLEMLVRHSMGQSIGRLFLIGGFIAVLSVISVVCMRSTRLRTHFNVGPDEPSTAATPADDAAAVTSPDEAAQAVPATGVEPTGVRAGPGSAGQAAGTESAKLVASPPEAESASQPADPEPVDAGVEAERAVIVASPAEAGSASASSLAAER
jgi:hypothetical protein